jgi:serine/threonine-protein kinase RsbW
MPVKHMPARLESLPELTAFITDQAQKIGLPQDNIDFICLAVEEALVNVFNYAYPAATGDVEVHVNASGKPPLGVEIRDTGAAFNPLSLPEPDLEADVAQRKVGGLGIFLIRRMADQVQYRREGNSNILTLTFPAGPQA